jgi:hypothetical protein
MFPMATILVEIGSHRCMFNLSFKMRRFVNNSKKCREADVFPKNDSISKLTIMHYWIQHVMIGLKKIPHILLFPL